MAPCGEPFRLFVTVGSQLAFDRLVVAVGAWVRTQASVQAVAQIGASTLDPRALLPMEVMDQLAPQAYARCVREAHIIVAHAGMGSILTALETNKPLVLLPRRGHLRETRNDHQFDTARQLLQQQTPGSNALIRVALEDDALPAVLDQLKSDVCSGAFNGVHAKAYTPSPSHAALIESLRRAIRSSPFH